MIYKFTIRPAINKTFVVLFVIHFILLFEACNNDFSINAAHEDVYVLNCILHNDSNIQYAVISKNIYTSNGGLPVSDNPTQNIKGANVKFFYNDSVFVMRDTTIWVNNNQINCYYIKDLTVRLGKTVSIEASIPGGNKLKASIIAPKVSYGNFSNNFPQRKLNRSPNDTLKYKSIQAYNWDSYTSQTEKRGFMSLPQIEIYYQKLEGETFVGKKILVPLAYSYELDETGNLIPINQKFSFEKNCISTLDALNMTMRQISGNDPNKSNYIISKVLFNVQCMEEALSGYYSAGNGGGNDYTIKVRPTDVTNINGGKGIFGACYIFTRPMLVDKSYIESFGYRYVP